MVETFIEYQKLEKIEVDGLMGRWNSQKIEAVSNQFIRYMEIMVSISYDPLDLLNEAYNKSFLEDYEAYLKIIYDFDTRLATVSKTSFENCNNLMSLHKVNFPWLNFNVLNRTNNIRLLLNKVTIDGLIFHYIFVYN